MGFLDFELYFFFCKNPPKAFTKELNLEEKVSKDVEGFFKSIPQGGF